MCITGAVRIRFQDSGDMAVFHLGADSVDYQERGPWVVAKINVAGVIASSHLLPCCLFTIGNQELLVQVELFATARIFAFARPYYLVQLYQQQLHLDETGILRMQLPLT
jgi:hypothetical protein